MPKNQLEACITYCEQQNGLPYCKSCGLDKAMIDKALDTIRQEERRKTIEEIIENIPVCRDRITKCNCSDHDINDDVFNYLSTLENKKHE